MTSSTKKPYRRFRAHGRSTSPAGDELAKLRELNERAPGDQRDERRPPPPRRPDRDRRAAPAAPARRRWWSLRGLGPGGIALRLGGLVVLAVLVWATLGFLALRSAAGEANHRISKTARASLTDPGGGLLGTPENILVLGSDADRGRTGPPRADTVMIMRTDPDAGRIRYLSIPRDLRVQMPGQGHVKITEAYAHRGITGVVRAIHDEIGLPINHVMVIDFKGISRMVDAVGGVTVNNPYELRDCPYPGGRLVSFPRGKITLDGPRALVYVRVRKCDSDLERARRQQLVVSALKSKVLSWSSLPVAPWRGARMVRAISTDLSATDLVKLGWLQARLKSDGTDREILAGQPETIDGISYIVLDPGAAGSQLRRFERSSG